jgi:1-acyl-sn-glycerol-3-phosphate acyltransferase
MDNLTAYTKTLREAIIDESLNTMGLSKTRLVRRLISSLLYLPANRFAHLIVRYDLQVGEHGFRAATRSFLQDLSLNYETRGVECLPTKGPLLIASNHPGTFDGIVITASLPRDDLKIVLSGVPFTRSLKATRDHLIYTTHDTHQRMTVIRSIIRHLQAGGSLLIFPSGRLDPDPAFRVDAEKALEHWHASLAVILRRVPETQLVLTVASGMMSAKWLQNPLVKLLRKGWERQKLAEFFQTMQQIMFPGSITLYPKVTFAPPIRADAFASQSEGMMPAILDSAAQHLKEHQSWLEQVNRGDIDWPSNQQLNTR